MAISTTIKSIQDLMRKDAGVDGDAQRISQLVWMLFLKVFDDHEAEKELLDDGYKSPIPKRLRWRTWAKDSEGITGEALLDFINNDLFKTLKDLPAAGKTAAVSGVIRGVFEDAYNYMKSGTLIRQVVNTLNEVDFNRASDRHEFGDVYEKILSDLQSAGNAGEFYTPRAITQFIVDQVDPKLGEIVLDPACGTGGFLTCAIEHVRKKYVKEAEDEGWLQRSVFGVEKKPLPHLLCVTNMMFHGIEVPSNIRHDNTLARPLRDYGPKDRVDLVITNPPFGGMEEDGIENNFPAQFRTRETADLFLALIINLLKPGGRAAVVLPDGELLFGSDGVHARIKEKLLEECDLHTIVRLPKGVFKPYTDTKTNILFFTKGKPTKATWFYEHPYPAGLKSYSKTKPIRIDEFTPEKKWWKKREENERAWKLDIADIKERGYNLDVKNPRAVNDYDRDTVELVTDYRCAAEAASLSRSALLDRIQAGLSLDADRIGESETKIRQFAENFEVVSGAASNIRKLRELIFECAVRGRLVAQRAADEPASDLLARLNDQAPTNGVKATRGRRSHQRSTESVDHGPHALPGGWSWARFQTVASIDSNLVSPKKSLDLPHVAPDNIEKGTGRLLPYRTVREDGVTSSKHRFFPGQILYSKIRPNLSKAVLIDFDGLCSADMYPLTPLINVRYFHCYLLSRTFLEQVVRTDNRLAMPKVNQEQLLVTLVAVPPDREQQRIVSKVEELMTLCDQLEERLRIKETAAARLVDAVVADMVA